jgi:heme/copper-type cytochrome/quinol oxidase subunit 3
VLTAVLVASVAPMAAAVRAAGAGARRAAWWLLALAGAIQAGYLAAQVVSYTGDLGDFSPSTNAYGSIYFTLLGAHHLHVIAGLLLDGWLLVRLAGGLTSYRVVGLRAVALYWYVVAALAVAVVATQVSAA